MCAWREGGLPEGKIMSEWLAQDAMDKNPLLFAPVTDADGKTKTRDIEIEERDNTAMRMCSDKGAKFIVATLAMFYNDKILFADISKDECCYVAGDTVDRAFSYIILNEYEYEVKDTTQLITYANNLMESLYAFLTGLINGDTRSALVAIFTGGGYKVQKDESQQQPQESSPVRMPFSKK